MEQNATTRYRSMLERVKAGDLTVDLGELRRAFADSADFTSGSAAALKMQTIDAIVQRDFPTAIRLAQEALEFNYVDLDAHHALYFAYRETAQAEKSRFHFAVWKGLIDSILNSGDGRTRETALEVISIEEEYFVLRMLGLALETQALQIDQDHKYDVFKTRKPSTQEEVTLFFKIDRFYGR